MLRPMQLAAISSTTWPPRARCCWVLDALPGGLIVCCIILLRGVVEVWAGAPLGAILNYDALAFYFGLADLLASLIGACGIVLLAPALTAALELWLVARVVLEVFFALLAAIWHPVGFSGFTFLVVCVVVLLFDVYFAVFGLDLLLAITLRGSVTPSCLQLLNSARRVAMDCGDTSCDKSHMLFALLQDRIARRLFELGGVDVGHMERQFNARFSIRGVHARPEIQEVFPLSPDAHDVLRAAVNLQGDYGDRQLSIDHVLLAMCGDGKICFSGSLCQEPFRDSARKSVNASGVTMFSYAVDFRAIRAHISESHGPKIVIAQEGDQSTNVLGCLPLEETVVLWSIVKVAVCLVTILVAFFAWLFGSGLGDAFGLHGTWESRALEVVGILLGLGFAAAAVHGIAAHRKARGLVLDRAYVFGVPREAGLGPAFDRVRREPEANTWLRQLKEGAIYLKYFFYWSLVEIVLDIPILGMRLVYGNVCGAYVNGLANVSRLGIWFSSAEPIHCTSNDIAILVAVAAWVITKCVFCWLVFVLWHEYQHGWTSTDVWGISLLQPCSFLPETTWRLLAGLSRYAPRLSEVHGEAKPLLL